MPGGGLWRSGSLADVRRVAGEWRLRWRASWASDRRFTKIQALHARL